MKDNRIHQGGPWYKRRTRPGGKYHRVGGCEFHRPNSYRNRVTLLSQGEAAFFGPLCQALDGRFLVMCKVRLADIVTCSADDWRRGLGGAIAQKHLDFVLCDPQTTRFVLAIELDDRSHTRADRRRRDRFVNRVLAQAGVQLIRFRAAAWYSPALIWERILDRLHHGNDPRRRSLEQPHPDVPSLRQTW